MSVYYNKKLISGVREVPKMTLAEYNALTNKPDVWLRTDAPESDRGITASDVEYSTGVSVEDEIDSMVEVLTLTKGSKINNVTNVKAKVLNNATLVISGVAYVNTTINADEEILDLGKSFSQNFSFAYSLADGVRAIKIDGTKLKANVNIAIGNLYFSASINI